MGKLKNRAVRHLGCGHTIYTPSAGLELNYSVCSLCPGWLQLHILAMKNDPLCMFIQQPQHPVVRGKMNGESRDPISLCDSAAPWLNDISSLVLLLPSAKLEEVGMATSKALLLAFWVIVWMETLHPELEETAGEQPDSSFQLVLNHHHSLLCASACHLLGQQGGTNIPRPYSFLFCGLIFYEPSGHFIL